MDVAILFKGKKSDFRLTVKMKRAEIERFDWFIERIQTRVAFDWLSERSGAKTSCPRTF